MKLFLISSLFSLTVLATAAPVRIYNTKSLSKGEFPLKHSVKKPVVKVDYRRVFAKTQSINPSSRSYGIPILKINKALDGSPLRTYERRTISRVMLPLKSAVEKRKVNIDFREFAETQAVNPSSHSYRIPVSKLNRIRINESLSRPYRYRAADRVPLSAAYIDISSTFKGSFSSKQIPTTSSLPISTRQTKVTAEECSSTSECSGDRSCNTNGNTTRCIPAGGLIRCESNSDCDTLGELCGQDPSGNKFCVSETLTTSNPDEEPETDAEGGGVTSSGGNDDTEGNGGPLGPEIAPTSESNEESQPCIGVHLLQHLSREELIFERDRLAKVLCDEKESCATPGHVVSYHGSSMMMKSYCELIGGCVKKIMHVNSPRYRRGAIVPSKSEKMAFTAFSARYVTRLEEVFLALAIRMGF